MIDAQAVVLYRMLYMMYSGFAPSQSSAVWSKGLHAPASAVYIGL